MNELLHSPIALNNLSKFHNKLVVCVEGKDDRTFWSYFFKSTKREFHIKLVGGVEELKKYAEMIVSDNVNIIIASDSHYDVIFNNHRQHKKIIYTHGHSIENIMYCHKNLNELLKKMRRLDYTPDDTAHKWIESFCEDAKELMVFDMANEYYGKEVNIMSVSCQKFLKNNSSSILSKQKIEDFLNGINSNFQQNEIDAIKKLIEDSEMPVNKIIRGKFLTNGIINFLKQECKRDEGSCKTFTIESLFIHTVDGCQSCNEHCDSYVKMHKSCIDAINSLES